jgi:hypothetical protein
MKQTFYFRELGGWSFSMEVTINDDKHRDNFLASMKRRGLINVSEDEFNSDQRVRGLYRSMYYYTNKYR